MKILPLLLAATLTPMPAMAGYQSGQSGWSRQCFRNVYREEYIPGTQNNPGYVRRWNERQEVPCQSTRNDGQYHPQGPVNLPSWESPHADTNSCLEGSILGGIAGAAGGAALSRDEGMFIGIPLGIVGGAIIGCQLDGG